jgi:hypothetical protein
MRGTTAPSLLSALQGAERLDLLFCWFLASEDGRGDNDIPRVLLYQRLEVLQNVGLGSPFRRALLLLLCLNVEHQNHADDVRHDGTHTPRCLAGRAVQKRYVAAVAVTARGSSHTS